MPDLLQLSTEVRKPKQFLIDGVPYDMYTTDHLSDAHESEVQAWFARHQLFAERLAMTDNTQLGVKLADGMREAQLKVISLMTNVPGDVAVTLPPSAKAKLIEALTIELVDEGGKSEATREAPAPAAPAPTAVTPPVPEPATAAV